MSESARDEANGDAPETDRERQTLGALFTRLGDQIRTLIRAELGVYRAEAEWRAISLGWAAAFGFGALALLQAVTVALFVGLIMALAPLWGTGFAVLVVTLGGLAVAGLLAWLGYRKIAAVLAPASPKDTDVTS
jgi:Putative Actinobacterial Holin-X, holin superfamily III